MLEPKIQMVLDRLSNGEFDRVRVEPDWIEEAGEQFKAALRNQLTDTGKNDFRLRMSNVGRPLCQLQMAAQGAKESRKPYNFIMRMMLGDAAESILGIVLKAAGANITGANDNVELDVAGVKIRGTDDVEIDNEVYDIKSCSPWAFDNKWSSGYEHFKNTDTFGYIGQLFGYAAAKGKKPGGWITVCKSSGRIKVLSCDASPAEEKAVKRNIATNVKAVNSNQPFKRCFEPEDDKWRGKSTGRKRLGKTCEFCPFLGSCWPEAEYLPHPNSEAKNPPRYWYLPES